MASLLKSRPVIFLSGPSVEKNKEQVSNTSRKDSLFGNIYKEETICHLPIQFVEMGYYKIQSEN